MKTDPTSLLRVVVVLAMLGSQTIAQQAESKATIEVNGKKADASDGAITIRADGEDIEIDTDGDGKAEERIGKDTDKKSEAKVAWLGVKTNDLSAGLASQLDLEGGALIEMVVPGSPAAKAGLQDHDIITAVGVAEIGDPQELSSAIRALKPNTETKITVVRKAKPVELTATLGERPQMPQHGGPPEFRGAHGFDLEQFGNDPKAMREHLQKMMRQMRIDLDAAPRPDGLAFPREADIVRMSSKTTSFSDGNGSITITTKDGDTHIKAKDVDGKLIYEGPAETDEDRKKLPPEVLEKLERFEKMNVDIDIKGFRDKLLPPNFDLPAPELKPAKSKKAASNKTETITAAA